MAKLSLNSVELAILRGAVRRGDTEEVYAAFLEKVSQRCDFETHKINLDRALLAEIQHFGFECKNPRWQATMVSIFQRTLGKNLGRDTVGDGHLVETPRQA